MRVERAVALLLLACVLAANVYRAATQSVTADEAFAYLHLVAEGPKSLVDRFDACHHALHTYLTFISTRLFGLNDFTLRIPSLLGGALYLWAAYRLSRRLFGEGAVGLLSIATLSLNPLILDHLSIARGYGLGLGLLLWGFDRVLEYFLRDEPNSLSQAGLFLGLAVAANLTILFPAAALALLVAAYLIHRKGLRDGIWLWTEQLGGPGAVVAFVLMVLPFAHAGRENFYFGSRTFGETIETLLFGSLLYRQPPFWLDNFYHWAHALIRVLPWLTGLVVLAGLWLGRRSRLVGCFLWPALTVGLLWAANRLFGVLLPRFRTGLYLYVLFGFAIIALISLTWHRGWAWRGFAVLPGVQIIVFLYAFELRAYNEFRYDAGTERLMNELIRHEGLAGRKIRLGPTPILGMTVNYYRLRHKLRWLEPCARTGADGEFDYYALLEEDHLLLWKRGLEVLYIDADSKVILARRGKGRLN
jgi:hypothetical protein